MPIFNGFVSKNMTIFGASEAHQTFVALGLEIAAVGTFISVGLKLPYFAFWGGKPTDWKRELKPIPRNMYFGMGLLSILCIVQGVFPQALYNYLPFPEAVHEFVPWTPWHVLQALMLLGFSGLAFYLMRNVITPHKALNLDFDWFYRLVGQALYLVISRPAAWIDSIWTDVWNTVGLRGLMGSAFGTVVFDKSAIDGIVDNTAYGTRGFGAIGALLQNGRLQYYLGLMTVLALGIFALFFYGVL
jgi:multicomponent Na+:H+ antiporter subunit D